jgi:hypothetical protein
MVITAFFDSYIFNSNFVETCCREDYKFLVERIVGAVVLELGIYIYIYIYSISVWNVVTESQVITKWEHAWLIFSSVTFY